MKPRILLVDNKPDYLDTLSRLFKIHDFNVFTASSPAEAREAMETRWFHVAVIDVRLEDDNNPHDVSGLLLAREPRFGHIPKIIVTNWPTWQAAVKALKALESVSGYAPAVDYLAKDVKFDVLLETTKRAISENTRINWELTVDWHGCDKFSLLSWIQPDRKEELIVERVEELEDLLRRLFYEKKLVRIDRALWSDKERASLMVTAFDNNDLRETFAVTCGPRARILKEAARYHEFVPKGVGSVRTALTYTAEVNHFAANAYKLIGTVADDVHPITELYLADQGDSFKLALDDLFKNTLMQWGDGSLILKKRASPDEIYLDRLGLNAEEMFSGILVEKLHALADELQRINMEVDFGLGSLIIRHGSESFKYPDPIHVITYCHKSQGRTFFIRTPGRCAMGNILADISGRAWVTDFGYAGLAPAYWNSVEIEAEIRFDWTTKSSIQSLHYLERTLVRDRFTRLNLQDLDLPLRKPVRAIISVRKLASSVIGKDVTSYHTGILFQALSRVMSFSAPEAIRMSNSELVRVAHAFISISIIGEYILRNSSADERANVFEEIRLDAGNREVWVGSTRIRLQPRSFDILNFLYEKANQLCSRAELIERVFNERYDEMDESQVNRLNSAIFRLRQQLESDPDNPKYVVTEPKGGYKLMMSGR